MKYLEIAPSLTTCEKITWTVDEACIEGSLDVIPLTEDKQLILDKLVECLKLTRNLHDLIYLKYFADNETVVAHFPNGNKTVNVAMDSGTMMIRDVIRGIV